MKQQRTLPFAALIFCICATALLGGCATAPGATTVSTGAAASPSKVPLPAAELATAKEQVIATERAFAKSMADRDLKAFATFVGEDTVFYSGPKPLHGKQAVVDFWSKFFTKPEAPFSWEPKDVEVLDAGDLAISSGPVYDPSGKEFATFSSIWRREGPNTWHIVFDKGASVCDCKAKAQ